MKEIYETLIEIFCTILKPIDNYLSRKIGEIAEYTLEDIPLPRESKSKLKEITQ